MYIQISWDQRAHLYCGKNTTDHKKIALWMPGLPSYPKASRLAEHFFEKGYDILSPMYPGSFDSAGDFSLESSVSAVKIRYDYILAGKFLEYMPHGFEKHYDEVLLMGDSYGAFVLGLGLMNETFPKVRKALLFYPVRNPKNYQNNETRQELCKEEEYLMPHGFPFTYRIGNRDKRVAQNYRGEDLPVWTDKNPHIAKTFIHGKNDEVCPPEMSEEMVKEFTNVTRHLLDGNHGTSTMPKEELFGILDRVL